MDKGELEHAEVVFGRLFEAGKNAATFLQPADEPFNDVSLAVCLAIELNGPGVGIFIALRRNDGCDARRQQILVDPVGAEALVACQANGAQHLVFLLAADECSFQKRFQGLRFVRLPGRDVDVEGVAVPIAEQVDFGRKSAPRAA